VSNGTVRTGRNFVEFGLRDGRGKGASGKGGAGGGVGETAEIKKIERR
jgi:hypothetical protein